MPEGTMNVQSALESLEDYNQDFPKTRLQNYKIIQNALEKDEDLSADEVKRLLTVCVHDTPLMKYTPTVINTISALLSKLKAGRYDPPPDLVPSAAAVISVLKTIALLSKVESLITLCLDAVFSYPEDTLVTLTEHHCQDVLEIFNLCCHTRIPMHIRLQACNLLHKLLKIMPCEMKKEFIEKGVSVWFSKVIPTVMSHMSVVGSNTDIYIQILELLTNDLIHVDYTSNSPWYNILECICIAKQYPAMMKALLHAGNDAWCRLWIIFIRLLKHQITQSLSSVGTPINSMLPVVEAAFKLDINNRCKAFECWNVLIDSFSTETNESNINKRIKLLIIPLKSNNAKTEETAIAKFKCWWHLIRKFQNKMDKFLEIVLVSFLHFCFGRHNAVDKSMIVPGQISTCVKKFCNEALVDMIGHVNCDGCTDLPKLKGKIITTKHLVDNWNHWIYSLTSVIMRTAKNDCGLTRKQMKCLWTSFLMTIGDLPQNNIRKDLFAEILSILTHLVQECKSNNEFLDITFNILILSLFEGNTKIKQLFKSDNNPNDPINRIVTIIMDSSLYGFYKSLQAKELLTKFKQLTNLMLDEEVCNPINSISMAITDLPVNDYGLLLWSALAESIYESEYHCDALTVSKMIMWPIKSICRFTKLKVAAMTWYTTYDLLYLKTNTTNIEKEVSDILVTIIDTPETTEFVYFKLCVVLAVLKHKFTENNCMACEKEINLLLLLTKGINSYEYFEPLMPMLVDRIVAIMSIVTTNVNDTVTALILVCVKNVLHILTQTCKQRSEPESNIPHILLLIANLLKPLELLFVVESYSKLIPAMTYHLLRCSPLLSEHSSTQTILLSVMKSILSNIETTDDNYDKVKKFIDDIENIKLESSVRDSDHISENKEFTTPQAKEVIKQPKKKEVSIVNTVVENGEEYVVVKSNWKFNPRKLTENQKERLQRKREDIPALYQDLSQSQDEFRLASWKTDSQDTTSSSKSTSKSSKPGSNESAAEILKNLPSTNVVPKILETILSENDKKVTSIKDLSSKDNASKLDASTPATKNAQSPRMALKDRVFRNMRNLMESSGLQKENKDSTEDRNKNDNYSRTPPSTKNSITNLVNSAPCLLAERPSRVKRKPKKFEDLELLTAKKRRNSLPDTQTDKVEQSKHVTAPKSNQNVDTIVTADIEMEDDVNESINLGNIANSDISYNEQNMVSENNDITVEITDDEVNKSPMKNASSQLVSVFNDDAKTDLPNASSIDTKSKDVMEVTITKTPAKVGRLSTPKSSRNENQMIISSNGEQTLATNTSVDVKDVSTPKSSKVVQEVSTLIASKLFMPQSGDVEQMSSPKACNMKQGSTIKVLEANKEKSSLNATKDNNEVSTPKISEDIKNLPETSINVSEDSAPTTNNEIVELATSTVSKDIKDVSTPAASKIFKEISTPTASKNVKEVSTPTASKNIKEVATPTASMNIKEVATPTVSKNIKEVSTPTASQNIKEVSTSTTSKNFKEISTPTASKNVKEVSTPTASKNIKEVSTPTASKRIKDGTTPQPSKQISKPLSTKNIKEHLTLDENKELTTPKQTKESKDVITPKQSHKVDEQKSTTKKSTIKKSRIEKELAIDTVEGHPFLKIQSGKRLTRKALETVNSGRRKSLANKLNKSKVEGAQKIDKKSKDKNKETENTSTSSVIVDESQEQNSEQTSVSDELPDSDDIIESSQDSTMTTISVKSRRKTPVKLPVVCVKKWTKSLKKVDTNNSQSILDCVKLDAKSTSGNAESKDDSVLPLNKTALVENSQDDLTENMDTEPLDDVNTSEDVILVNSDVPVVTLASEVPTVGPESQELAEADTQPTDPKQFMEIDDIHETSELSLAKVTGNHIAETCSEKHDSPRVDKDEIAVDKTMDGTVDNTTLTLSDSAFGDRESASSASSPFKDEAQRQKDFLNNTVEISPIKIMSPDRNKKSPSPETSNDFVVIKLSSPVQSNGEPFENGGSPEVFTEEKVSPDKRDQSPPRGEVTVTNTSPNSSLSLKKNRPQVRSGGRAAQMLGLCVPEKIQAIVNPERSEPEDVKKSSTNTPARRNLRILYNSVGENTESSNGISENDDSDNFLKFRRSLPAVDCSPSGPILKRKLAEITDDAMVSPASKRKRVSFHDPPVSTTISVQKYIEPGVLRSPQNSAHKRLERQLRQYTPQKSPKRLDNVFKLDTVLTKTVASFTEGEDIIIIPDDTQAISLDITPIVEVVRTSELNNTDPICPDLLGCNDPIENIASELSSPAMKSLLIKELDGTIETIGDLAKLTELEVNRLCIKAPKVTVAKKVLSDYAAYKAENLTIETEFAQSMSELEKKTRNIEIQTDINKSIDVEMQTENIPTTVFAAQTESVSTAHCSAQTKESGCKSSKDIIKSCLSEKPDFVAALGECLEEPSIQHLSEKLLLSTVTDLLMKKITPSDTRVVLDRLLEKETNSSSDNTKGLSFIRDYVCDKFETKDLLLLCSQILKIVYDKPA